MTTRKPTKPKKVKLKIQLPKVKRCQQSTRDAAAFPVDHYSSSSMVLFSSNPILFKVRYINRDEFDTTNSASSILGKAFHHAMQVYFGGSDTLIPMNEAEAIEYGLKSGMDFLEKYDDGYINFSKTIPNKQKLFDKFTFIYLEYIKQKPYKTDEEILMLEQEMKEYIEIEWRGQKLVLPVMLKGFADKIVRDAQGRIVIRDYKTTGKFTSFDKIDGEKIIQAVVYYLLAFAVFGEEPYSMIYEEIKHTKNDDKSSQLREYEMVFGENDRYFDFFFRFYDDITRALNGEMVYVPNVRAMYDNEIAMVTYIYRLDETEEVAKLMKKHHVSNLTDLLKKKIQSAGNMRKLMKQVEAQFVSAKNLDYDKMTNEEKIKTKMLEHGMAMSFEDKIVGANVELYRFTPSIGLKMSRIEGYVADVEQVLGVSGVRVLAPIKNTSLIGFEVPRKDRIFPQLPTTGKGFDMAIGQDVMGDIRRFDVRESPHMLVAGTSGSGKSVFLSTQIEQLNRLAKNKAEIHLFDPKLIELASHRDDKNVVEYETDIMSIHSSLKWLVDDMNRRYATLSKAKVKNIALYDGNMPYRFVFIDEFGDLILQNYIDIKHVETGHVFTKGARAGQKEMEKIETNISKEIEQSIVLLAQKARAAGIHLIISTQRPSVNVVSGSIKANFPTRVVLRTASEVDSKVVMDRAGAEKLMGKGDMLFISQDGVERLQGFTNE